MIITPGRFHRLGIAVGKGDDDAAEWFADHLGAEVSPTRQEPGDEHLVTMARIGRTSLAVFTATGSTGAIGRYVARQGPGLHSVAWRVDDLWIAENVVRNAGIQVTGTNLEARHFFMHPRDTFGLMIEFTDAGASNVSDTTRPTAGPAVDLAWTTAVVRDVRPVFRLLESIMEVSVRDDLPAGPSGVEDTMDVQIGDSVLRLVSPRSISSRYARFLDQVGERLHSFAVTVDDVDAVAESGLPVVDREDGRVWTDPAATLGLRIEWVQAEVVAPGA